MLKLSLSVRTLSTTSQLLKDGDMIQAIFLKKIREFAQKVAAGQLMRPAEVGFFYFCFLFTKSSTSFWSFSVLSSRFYAFCFGF